MQAFNCHGKLGATGVSLLDKTGMTTLPDKLKATEDLVQDVRGQHQRLEKLVQQFRERIGKLGSTHDSSSLQQSGNYWRMVAFVDSLVRLRLFLEQNFNYIETMSILSVARYTFELTVWLKLLEKDSGYGLVYYRELLKKQLDFYTEFRNNAVREVSFLRHTEATEDSLMQKRLSEIMQVTDEDSRNGKLREMYTEVTHQIDSDAARKFSLYADEARTNGYGYQAHLVEAQILPEYSKIIADLEQKLKAFDCGAPFAVKALAQSRWKWNKKAALVGMKDEYDFIYAYASRLLHATPASLTTNQKNLEPDELLVFLRYIRVRLLDAAEMAEKLLATEPAGNP
jgi:hypothetical protein